MTQCRYRIVQKTVLAWDIFRFPSGPLQGGTIAPSSSSKLIGVAVQ
ncbi:colicin release lysis protein [Escherichia coli]|nr:colicin release lysis protein [Escherichia coli]